MKLRQCVLATIGSMALMGTFLPVVPGRSEEQGYLSVAVVSGNPMDAHASFQAATRDGEISPGSMVISILDERGLASGWTVIVEFRAMFSLYEPPREESRVPIAQGIEVLQGNPELAGHTVQRFRAGQATDSLSWTAAKQFGDGHYALTLEGTPSPGLTATHTIFVTMCGSAP